MNWISFACFFSVTVIQHLVHSINLYAWKRICQGDGLTYANSEGLWNETTVDEMERCLALIIYMSLVKMPTVYDYWKTMSPFHGSWARALIRARTRFVALMTFLHVSHPDDEDPNDKLRKVRWLYEYMKQKCAQLYQPRQKVSVDEQMVKMKGRSHLRQHMPKEPIKWGIKIFAACDVSSSYLFNFDVYTGAVPGQVEEGLTHAVITRILANYHHQGYVAYTDNFYTSPTLAASLTANGIQLVGTLQVNRAGVPATLKGTKQFERCSPRGSVRYVRINEQVFVQWVDKWLVTMLSTFHNATKSVMITRNTKQQGQHVQLQVQQPFVVKDYNSGMGGVDVFDQQCVTLRIRRKSHKYWKALFYDFIEVATVNSFILFNEFRRVNPGVLPRKRTYSHEDFRVALFQQLGQCPPDAPVQ